MSSYSKRIANLSPAKRALLNVRLQKRTDLTSPIAIIGVGCRFPGAKNPEAFWHLLRDGIDAITEVPPDRWNADDYYDPNPSKPGKTNTRWGGFLDQVDQFDPHFFGISPREAARMDPQQRLLLHVAWEALEDAGQAPERLAGTQTGIFVGISTHDYSSIQLSDPALIDGYAGTGNALSICANRLSYFFDFRGPSMAIDTSCSSSLVAVHLGCQSLWNKECTLALVGGVNVILSPAAAINFTKAGASAPDGRCKTFDARANGYVRGEGAGIAVLKPLSVALADGDPIYAVIRGSAVNQDGRTNGLMAPSRQAQEALLREAYRRAGVSPGEVQYIEAHGTGTLLGDPIEAIALGSVLATDRPPGRYCTVGSVKTNLGHLEAAAGIAGLIKVALSLKHQAIPPSLHFQEPNPHIPFDELPLRVQQNLGRWSEGPGPALAGVSSFGFGGTNAHVVLEEAPKIAAVQKNEEVASSRAHLLLVSARSAEALKSLARQYQDVWAIRNTAPEMSLDDLAYTASVRRSHHDHRLALAVHSREEIIEGLGAFLQEESRPNMSLGQASGRRRRLVFVFPGQGSQWLGMGRQLLESESVFRTALEQCDRAMRQHVDWSLLEELAASETRSRLDEIDFVQPALFAIQAGLGALWRSWGVEPDAVVGQSMGEVAAAHFAGALSLEDAVRVICHRSRLLKRVRGQGKMAAVELSFAQAQLALAGYEDRISIAVSNSPVSTVFSGEATALEELLEALQRQNIFCRQVKVDIASHSPQMEPVRDELLQTLANVHSNSASLPLYSTVTGLADPGQQFDANYWWQNLRRPVLFSEPIQQLLESGHDIFVEVSPHPILSIAISECLRHRRQEGAVLPSLRRNEEERAVMLGSLGTLYTLGRPVDWNLLYPFGGQCVRLPTYPWQQERCWLETEDAHAHRDWRTPFQNRNGKAMHPLLGRYFDSADSPGDHFWEIKLDKSNVPYLDDHRVQGAVVLPGAAFIEMALAAAAQAFGPGPRILTDIEFQRALILREQTSQTVQFVLSSGRPGEGSFRIYSRPNETGSREESWILNVMGRIQDEPNGSALPGPEPQGLDKIRSQLKEEITGEDYYLGLRKSGIEYGPCFQGITRLWRTDGEALGELRVPQELEMDTDLYHLHPAVLDAGWQALGASFPVQLTNNGKAGPAIPIRIDQIRVRSRPGGTSYSHASFRPEAKLNGDALVGDVRLFDETGQTLIETLGLRLRALEPSAEELRPKDLDEWLYEPRWQPRMRFEGRKHSEKSSPGGTWLLFADEEGIATELKRLLIGREEKCVLVTPGKTFQQIDPEHFQIRPANSNDLSQVLEAVFRAAQSSCRGIVHLWGVEAPAAPKNTKVAALEAAQTLGCGSVLNLIQSLARVGLRGSPRLWLITRGAQPVGESPAPLAIAQSPLWGFGRVIAQEHPALWGGLIDLDPAHLPGEAGAQLVEEISNPDGEDQIAFRLGTRYVARLGRKDRLALQTRPLRWQSNASYLITGGLGDLGLEVARWMVEQGARRLVLVGRTKLPPRSSWNQVNPGERLAHQVRVIRELEALGASVHLASVDVADERQLTGFLEEFRQEGWPPIRGVVHAAGEVEPKALMELDAASLNAVLRAKVYGGWLLHQLLDDPSLDFFVLFSSFASVLSSPLLGSYAAANAFLDALAHHRRSAGRPALSINWAVWSDVGMAARYLRTGRVLLRGVESFTPAQGLQVLGRLLVQDSPQVGVMRVDWHQWRRLYPAFSESPFLSQLMSEEAGAVAERDQPAVGRIRDSLLAAEPEQRQPILQTYLHKQAARVLGLSVSKLDVQRSLTTLGFDSLMAVELRNRVEADLEISLPLVELIQGPSITQLGSSLFEKLMASSILSSDHERDTDPPADSGWEIVKL